MFKDKHKYELKEALEVAECACKLYPDECHIEKTDHLKAIMVRDARKIVEECNRIKNTIKEQKN